MRVPIDYRVSLTEMWKTRKNIQLCQTCRQPTIVPLSIEGPKTVQNSLEKMLTKLEIRGKVIENSLS